MQREARLATDDQWTVVAWMQREARDVLVVRDVGRVHEYLHLDDRWISKLF
jgi:hypothetical protein